MPTPPSITAAPVAVLVDWSTLSTSNLPAITPLPPILIFSSIPTPPSTISAPVSLSVEVVASLIIVWPPTFNLFSIPTPPSTISAPVSLSVDSVVPSIFVSPPTSSVPWISVLPLSVSTTNLSTPAAVFTLNVLLSAVIETLSRRVVSPSTSNPAFKVVLPSTSKAPSKSTSPETLSVPSTSKVAEGLLFWMPTFDILKTSLPTNPQKSFVCMSTICVGFVGLGIGTNESTPVPLLFICLKLNTVNDCATPVVGIYWPSSWTNTPSVKDGSNDTQRTPTASLCKKNPFPPGDPAES